MEKVFVGCLVGREGTPFHSPGGTPAGPAAWCPSSQGEEGARQTPWPQKESQSAGGGPKAAVRRNACSPNTGAATRGQWEGETADKAFEPSLVESISPEVAPSIVPLSALTPKAHPIGYLLYHKEMRDLWCFFFFS